MIRRVMHRELVKGVYVGFSGAPFYNIKDCKLLFVCFWGKESSEYSPVYELHLPPPPVLLSDAVLQMAHVQCGCHY